MSTIVHVVESLDRGGLERMVCDLAGEQTRRGHKVHVVCLFREGLLASELHDAGVDVSLIGKRTGKDVGALWRLRQQLRGLAPDVIHTHNATANYHVVVATAAGGRSCPVVNTRHGMGGEPGHDRRETWYRMSLRGTAAVVAVCWHAAHNFVSRGVVDAGKLAVIANGIRLERFAGGSRSEARHRLGLAEDAHVVGTVGRLNWAKDHPLLLEAVAKLRSEVPALRAIIVGAGETQHTLTEHIAALGLEDCVMLTGDRSDVAELLPGFDLFALSSRTEGYSIALLEAAAAGLPMVVTDVGGNREIVQDGITGRVVPHADATALAYAMSGLLLDDSLRSTQAAASRDWALRHASLPAMADQYERLYVRLSGGSAH